MTSATDDLRLAADFPQASVDDWRKLVDGVLKGAPYDKLVGKTYDGLKVQPIYDRAKGAGAVVGRAPAAPWQVMQRIDHPDAGQANAQALLDLENGATGLTLVMAGSINANGYGLDASAATIERVLDGVMLDAGITIDFNLSRPTRNVVQHFAALVNHRKIDPAAVDMRASINPIGGFAVSGTSPRPWNELATSFGRMVSELAQSGFRGPFAVADGRVIHNAGGSEAQELSFVIASAVEYLRALAGTGVPLDTACGMIYFRMAADADQFLTIAKFRALRKLWARIADACGVAPKAAYVTAETAWRMLTRRDPYVNMLRATMATFSAGLGGADSIAVLPHTAALGLPDAFARRVARNTQLILLEEANLAKVADPAAGSGAIEDLTSNLCKIAWSQFQTIEAAGGIWAALERDLVQKNVAMVRAERQKAVARRKDAMTGASEFPNLHEEPADVLDVAPLAAPLETVIAVKIEPLPRLRLAEPFETLRDRSDQILKASGQRPRVFLANLGSAADFTARATFAKSFFEAGGIEAVDSEGFSDPSVLAAAWKASGTALVCICSSDKVYLQQAVGAARALTAAGAKHIYLAGRPGEQEAALRDSGIADFIVAGGDVLQLLREAYGQMERT
jgi:methylmalonyl-CoA mutase